MTGTDTFLLTFSVEMPATTSNLSLERFPALQTSHNGEGKACPLPGTPASSGAADCIAQNLSLGEMLLFLHKPLK